MKRGINKLLAVFLSFAMVLTGFTFLGGATAVSADDGDKPEIGDVYVLSANEQPAAGGSYQWAFYGIDDSVDWSEVTDADFGMEVKAGDGEWAGAPDVTVKLDRSDDTYDGVVIAEVPDNTEPVVKQWRFTYAGGIVDYSDNPVDAPAITQAAGEASAEKPEYVTLFRADGVDEFQPASGGTFRWLAMDVIMGEDLRDRVTAEDFELHTKKAEDQEWSVASVGTLSVENATEEDYEGGVYVTAALPDNTDDYDKNWSLVYKHGDPSTQTASCDSNKITQMKPEAQAEKPSNVFVSFDEGAEEFQPAAGGSYVWLTMDAETYGPLCGLVDADDFKLQTRKATDSEWTDAAVGTLALEDFDDYYVKVTANGIPDNTDDFDKQWRLVYVHSDPSIQLPTGESNVYTQQKPEAQPAVKPAIESIDIDEATGSGANQPAEGGVYAWYVLGGMDADFSEVTADDFSMEVKTGDGEWTASDAALQFEIGTNDDEGIVTAAVPDNTEDVEKQWRFRYAGESVECPAITQAAKSAWNEACFTYTDDNTTITGLTDAGKEMLKADSYMVLPDSHNGVDITAIGNGITGINKLNGADGQIGTFGFNEGGVTYVPEKVKFPAGLKKIGNMAFFTAYNSSGSDQKGLTELTLPDTLEEIGQQAFAGIPVTEVTIPDNVTTIGVGAFAGAEALGVHITKVNFPAAPKFDTIPQNCFTTQLIENVTIPEGVKTVGRMAFNGCEIKTLSLPEGLVTIDNQAFMNHQLETLTLPKSLKTINQSAFRVAVSPRREQTLKTLNIPADAELATIAKQAFAGSSIVSADIPESVTTLDVAAFDENTSGTGDGRATLNLTSEDQFNGTGAYSKFTATGNGHRCVFNGQTNYVVSFDTGRISTKNDAYTKNGVLTAKDLEAPKTNETYDVFDGWFTEATGGEQVDTNTVFTADTTVYAHWSENTALKDAEEAIAAANAAAAEAQAAADKAAESKAAAEEAAQTPGPAAIEAAQAAEADAQAAAEAAAAAKAAADTAKEKSDAATEFAATHSVSSGGASKTKTAAKNAAAAVTNAEAAVAAADEAYEAAQTATKVAVFDDAKKTADEAAQAAADAAVAAANAEPGTQDAVDKAAAAKAAADEALAKAEAAAAAAEAAYGADSEQAQNAADAVTAAQNAASEAAEAQAAAEQAKADADKAKEEAEQAIAAAEKAKEEAEAAAAAAAKAAEAAANAKPGTQDAVDKAAAAKAAADEALAKAEAAKAAAEKAYGADSEEAKAAAAAVTAAETAAANAETAKKSADKAKADADKKAEEEKAAADKKAAEEAAAAAKEAKAKKVKTVTVNVKKVTAKAVNKAVAKAGGSNKYVTKIVLGKKVKKISKNAFKNYKKVKTIEVRTKKLTKKSVKNSLKGSKVKTIKVKVVKKAAKNKKYVKKYKKIFKKANVGKKVKVKK